MIKPFLKNKGHINGEGIILKYDNYDKIWQPQIGRSVLAEMFNSYHKNIVNKKSGKRPNHFARDNKIYDTTQDIDFIF